jgi:hypothetical protein
MIGKTVNSAVGKQAITEGTTRRNLTTSSARPHNWMTGLYSDSYEQHIGEVWVQVAPVITGITFVCTFHMHWTSISDLYVVELLLLVVVVVLVLLPHTE